MFSARVLWLPELSPTRLHALRAGSGVNIGRVIAALGPAFAGVVAARVGGSPDILMHTLRWAALIPLVAVTARRVSMATHGRELPH